MSIFFRRKRRDEFDDEPDMSIIDALNRQPPPPVRDWAIRQPTFTPNPPSRHARPELHITAGRRYLNPPPLPRPPRPSMGRLLLGWRATLPLFHRTADMMGWSAVIPPPRPVLTTAGAFRSIEVFSDKTVRVICSNTEAASAELWERARDYDQQEAEIRAKRPLRSQRGIRRGM